MSSFVLKTVSRRRVLALLGLAVPAAAACSAAGLPDSLNGGNDAGTRQKGTDGILPKGPTGDAATSTDGLDIPTPQDTRAAELEARGPIYNAQNPGPTGAQEKHVPTLSVSGTTVTVEVLHEMRPARDGGGGGGGGDGGGDGGGGGGAVGEHYITTIYVRDAQRRVVFLKEFAVTDAAPTVSFTLPPGASAAGLVAYAYCNLHGLWSSQFPVLPATCKFSDPTWAAKVTAMEAGGVFTAALPGNASPVKHIPIVDSARGVVQVSVPHEMRPASGGPGDGGTDGGDAGDAGAPPIAAHYIGAVYIRDQAGTVIGFKEFAPNAPFPVALFCLPPGTTSVTAYAWCNLHGNWKAEPTRTVT